MSNHHTTTATLDASKTLAQTEITALTEALKAEAAKSKQGKLKLAIVLVGLYTGLRVSEVATLSMADVRLDGEFPTIRVKKENSKNGKGGEIPIYSKDTVEALKVIKAIRLEMGAKADDVFFCSLCADSIGKPFSRQGLRDRFVNICNKVLGGDRKVSFHTLRHSCASMALAKGLGLVEVKNLMRHSSVSVTNIYLSTFRKVNQPRINLDMPI